MAKGKGAMEKWRMLDVGIGIWDLGLIIWNLRLRVTPNPGGVERGRAWIELMRDKQKMGK